MYRKLTLLAAALLLFVQASFAQTIEIKTETKTETEISAELKKQAVAFLRESAGDVNNLRTLENRISFASEMASLMWFHDEKEARAMMNSVIGDFKQLIAQYDAQITAQGIELPEGDNFYGGFFGSADPNSKTNTLRKLSMAMAPVRQQIALSIAEHDPQLAVNFYNDSLQMLSNPEVRKRFEEQNSYFEAQLVNRIAEKNPAKALEFARKSLAKGLNYNHIELLKKIYDADAEKGADFAEAIAGKFKEKVTVENNNYLGSVLQIGADNFEKAKKENKKPMFTEQTLRDLADLSAQFILKSADLGDLRNPVNLQIIEKYAPARAVQIRSRTTQTQVKTAGLESGRMASADGMETAVMMKTQTVPIGASAANGKNEQKDAQEEMMKSLQNLGAKKLPKEEREKVVGQARKIIAATPNRQQKIVALSALAAQVAKLGDQELASDIMKDARALVSSSPKNYMEFMETWMLVSGLAAADAEKAFPVLKDTILRLNDTISAFVKVGEFIDTSGEMIDDGEVQVGRFGGSMVKEMTSSLGGMADATILNLAKADFTKTKALTNRFDRQEVRILAKMLVLRAILGDKKKPTEEN